MTLSAIRPPGALRQWRRNTTLVIKYYDTRIPVTAGAFWMLLTMCNYYVLVYPSLAIQDIMVFVQINTIVSTVGTVFYMWMFDAFDRVNIEIALNRVSIMKRRLFFPSMRQGSIDDFALRIMRCNLYSGIYTAWSGYALFLEAGDGYRVAVALRKSEQECAWDAEFLMGIFPLVVDRNAVCVAPMGYKLGGFDSISPFGRRPPK